MMIRLKRGDIVRVRRAGSDDEWASGMVCLASGGGREQSVMVLLNGEQAVRTNGGGLIMRALPLTISEHGITSLFDETQYDVEIDASQVVVSADDSELALYQAAQKATDEIMGAGTYERLNGFDPSKGETHSKRHGKKDTIQ